MSKQANNMKDAYNNFYFQEGLDFSAPPKRGRYSDFYVERDSPYEILKNELLMSENPEKFLFSGHRGTGKSTELSKLAANTDIRERFIIVKYSIKEVLDIMDIDYRDFLVSFGAELFRAMTEDNQLELSPSLVKKIESWKNSFTENLKGDETIIAANIGGGVKTSGLPFFLDLAARLKTQRTNRKTVRETIEPKLRELIDMIQDLITLVGEKLSGKELLVIIEDMDKIPDEEKARKLYFDSGQYLAAPRCKIIYTFPIAFRRDPKFTNVIQLIGRSHTLQNIKLWERSDKERSLIGSGIETMTEFVKLRMNLELIEKTALKEAIRNSGGMMREMARIMQYACVKAHSKELKQITKEIIDEAVADARQEYEGLLTKDEYYEDLKAVGETRILCGEHCITLLNSRHILEYINGQNDNWYDINPIIMPLIANWDKVVSSRK